MNRKYSVICTNPPYANKLSGNLKKFVTDNYKDYSGDLFSVFMYRNFGYCKPDGYSGFMTPFVWMFIKTYEKLREYIITNKSITTLVQMEYSAFEEATVPICSFVLKNGKENQPGYYIRLSDFKGGMDLQKQKVLEAINNKSCGYFFETIEKNFLEVPGNPIAYWATFKLIENFKKGKSLSSIANVKKGLDTGDNSRFLRIWHEVNIKNTSINNFQSHDNKKWIPLQKGGSFRKWYGNNDYVINWKNNGMEIKSTGKANIRSQQFYFNEGITWSTISSSYLGMRYVENGFIFETAGNMMFFNENNIDLYYCLAYLCGKIPPLFMNCLNPTITTTVGSISTLPIVNSNIQKNNIKNYSIENINISKTDWDSFETSWDFKTHPLIEFKSNNIENSYNNWTEFTEKQFNQLKANEEELNKIFIDIYGLQDELTPEVEDKDVTIRKADKERDIKSFISYAVGCMLGRYSLDVEGLAYAGGEWDSSKYKTFIPDPDNCIPITDEEYFDDDIVGRFVEFVKIVFGEKTLEENLKFIADALGTKGKTSREVIRNYFLKDFIKDHNKIYQKRPIYWMFDSGKQNGFKALVYMHRWNADTIGNMRIEYLHRMQRVYEKEIIRMQDVIDTSDNNKAIKDATKAKEKLQKQLKEAKDYDEKVAHLALSRIDIDLDDGVKVNYEKVQTANDGKKLEILAKI